MTRLSPFHSKSINSSLIVIVLIGVIQLISLVEPRDNRTIGEPAQFCTIFSIALGDKVLFGNNEDYRYDPKTSFISFIPPQEIPNIFNLPGFNATINIYGLVVVGSYIDQQDQRFYHPQGGMNDQGLCYDANSIPDQTLDNTGDWSPMSSHWDILLHCATVDEVIDWYQNHSKSTTNWNGQWNYVDVSGAGVVVTATDGEMVFVRKEDESYLISTNFNLADPSSHFFDYPCERYDTASVMLNEIEDGGLTVDLCRDVLDATHFEKSLFSDIQTLYSTICDPIEKKIHLYYLHDFENVVTFDLEYEYTKGDTSNPSYYIKNSIVDRTYLMFEFFDVSQDDSSDETPVFISLGIAVIVLILVYFKKRQ